MWYDKFGLPAACEIDKPVYKKMFYDNADLSKADKALFTDVIDRVTWKYCMIFLLILEESALIEIMMEYLLE